MILAAGLGKRLRPLTLVMPKPLAPVANRPVIEHIALLLAEHGFTEVITNVSYLPEQIRDRLGDGSQLGINLTYSEEPEPLGTAGGVGQVRDFLVTTDSCLVISGDALTDIDLGAMREAHERNGGIATLATRRVSDTSEFGVVITDSDGRIGGFQEKPDPAEALSDLANCGIYMFRREIFDHFPAAGHHSPAGDDDQPVGFVDWAMDVFPGLLADDTPFHCHETTAYWNDIGSLGEYVQGNRDALEGAVKLRLDGERRGDVIAPAGFELGAFETIGPVLVGEGAEVGEDAMLHGPVVVGAGARIGAGAMVRDAVLLDGAEVAPGALLVGGVHGPSR